MLVTGGPVEIDNSALGWQELEADVEAPQAGYVMFYLKDGSNGMTRFDSLQGSVVSHLPETRHYYPFGREIADLCYRNDEGVAPYR